MTPVQWLAAWAIVSVIATPFIGEYLHNRRINREWQQWLDDEADARLERLATKLWLADEILEAEAFHLDQPQPLRRA